MNFTLKNYVKLLKIAKENFKFIKFDEKFDINEKVILWRHDIDFSPKKAFIMAEKEFELGIKSYYFFQVSSVYYNILEPQNSNLIRKIHSMGHNLGLHYDASVHNGKNTEILEENLKFEISILQNIISDKIKIFSLHNPTTIKNIDLNNLNHSGLLNASSSKLIENFKYCSDSNGYWRFDSLDKLILDENVKKLYVLTHPIWWQDKVMSPREKIIKSISDRYNYSINSYDSLLKSHKRKNIK